MAVLTLLSHVLVPLIFWLQGAGFQEQKGHREQSIPASLGPWGAQFCFKDCECPPTPFL